MILKRIRTIEAKEKQMIAASATVREKKRNLTSEFPYQIEGM
jgi:hypothetical protein